ncbi:PQQ-dependent sugar dehydrogenase [Membranihabitans marinus]|uniref:PQQ-dependent sugar dehydrogenase n=1 Tax=Membranihabitans marinus TaxID=1227546 RepID=UPI001F1C8155|nr:PQQ-dependent sugar dehydrogenase [Membranihabitans marinus]
MKLYLTSIGVILGVVLSAQPKLFFTPFYNDANQPLAMSYIHGQDDVFYIVERPGRIIRVNSNGQYLSEFLDISDRISAIGEGGLLGMDFHPNYFQNHTFYINYTRLVNNVFQTVIAQVRGDSTGTVADDNTLKEIYFFDQPFANHNGGDIHFGPDGYLYIATGDGGSGGDPLGNGQDLLTPLGKILRFAVHPQAEDEVYLTIPPSNPFADTDHALSEIFAYGLRNPWRFSFDKNLGDLWIADVGQGDYEEIHRQSLDTSGLNYGWNCREGLAEFINCDYDNFVDPVYVYAHLNKPACSESIYCGQSITGGYVYRGEKYPSLQGHYVFADYVSNNIWTMDIEDYNVAFQGNIPVANLRNIASFFEDPNGELYAMSTNGYIFKISADEATSILPGHEALGFDVYPNPADREIAIEGLDFDKLNIYSGQGLHVKSLTDELGVKARYSVSDLQPGIYYIVGYKGLQKYVSRLVVL